MACSLPLTPGIGSARPICQCDGVVKQCLIDLGGLLDTPHTPLLIFPRVGELLYCGDDGSVEAFV